MTPLVLVPLGVRARNGRRTFCGGPLAKQLIHDTHLPMAEVAMAAGFGSVRRFNATFQRLFVRPPASLRRSPPCDRNAMMAFLSSRAIVGVEAVDSQRYARTIAISEHLGLLTVEPKGPQPD